MLRIPVLYVPSFYGDIRLEPHKHDDDKTVLIAEKLSASEKIALAKLSEMALKKGWFDAARTKGEKAFVMEAGEHVLSVPLIKLQKSLVKLLKPGRTVVTAVRFTDGSMEEVREAKEPPEPDGIKDAPAKAITGATAVAAPTRGCPAPDFVKAEIKARGVLEAFLSPEQMEDFRRHNRFVTQGASTGHRCDQPPRQGLARRVPPEPLRPRRGHPALRARLHRAGG